MTSIERDILQFIAERSGEVSFCHVARSFGLGDPLPDLPEIIGALKDKGLLEETGSLGDMATLGITQRGTVALAKGIGENA
jgi:hypothetical protein